MKKLASLFLAVVAFACLAGRSNAASYARSPKEVKNIGYSLTITSITANAFNSVTSSTNTMPGAVYDVYLTSGTAGDYCVLYDTVSAQGLTAPLSTSTGLFTSQLGPRLFMGSTTADTVIAFDPPIPFWNGLYAACTNTGEGAAVEFETGRGLSGN